MAKVFVEKVCSCGKTFKTSNDSPLCYDCTLDEVCSGNPPEEGDFNTAGIRSGTFTDQDRAYLQHDLEAVENGTSSFDPDDEEEWIDWEEEEEEEEDDDEYDEEEDARLGHEG